MVAVDPEYRGSPARSKRLEGRFRRGFSTRPALLLLPCLLLGSACPLSSHDESALGSDGGVRELVPATPKRVLAPRFVMADEPLTARVWGLHEDPCTRFDRFETSPWAPGRMVDVSAWAVRPVGPCPGDVEAWDARLSIFGLPSGRRTVRVGEVEEADVMVLSAREDECGEPEPIDVLDVRLPSATYPGGTAEILVEVEHPTACHGPPGIFHEVVDGELHLRATARPCGPIEDATSCSPWSKPIVVPYDLGPLDSGGTRLHLADEVVPFSVVDSSECHFEHLAVTSVHAPRLVPGEEPLELSIRGLLPSACAAPDLVSWSASGDELLVDVLVRDCEHSCAQAAEARKIDLTVSIVGAPPGRWSVKVGGQSLGTSVFVAPQGACVERELPAESISAVLATSGLYTDLSLESIPAGRPIDVHVVGSLPDGCWARPRLELVTFGQDVGEAMELGTRALFCDLDCDSSEDGEPVIESVEGVDGEYNGNGNGEAPPDEGEDEDGPGAGPIITTVDGRRPFSAGWSAPAGLPAGTYDLIVDGGLRGSVTVE